MNPQCRWVSATNAAQWNHDVPKEMRSELSKQSPLTMEQVGPITEALTCLDVSMSSIDYVTISLGYDFTNKIDDQMLLCQNFDA